MKSCSMIMIMCWARSPTVKSGRLTGQPKLIEGFFRACDGRRRPQPFERPLYLQAEVWQHAVRNVVEVAVDIHNSGQGRDLISLHKRVGYGIACREAARHRDEIGCLERPFRLRFDETKYVRNRHAFQRIVLTVTTGVKSWLEIDPADRRMLNGEVNDLSDFVLIDATLYRRNQSHR